MHFKIKDLMIDVLDKHQPKKSGKAGKKPLKGDCGACSNCTGCTRCTGCSNCTGCTLCTGCSNCTGCSRCTESCHYGTPEPTKGHQNPKEGISIYNDLEKKIKQALVEVRKRRAKYVTQDKKNKRTKGRGKRG